MFPSYWSTFCYIQSNIAYVNCHYSPGMGLYNISEVFSQHIKGTDSFGFTSPKLTFIKYWANIHNSKLAHGQCVGCRKSARFLGKRDSLGALKPKGMEIYVFHKNMLQRRVSIHVGNLKTKCQYEGIVSY